MLGDSHNEIDPQYVEEVKRERVSKRPEKDRTSGYHYLSKKYNIAYSTLLYRINSGMSISEAVSVPVKHIQHNLYEHDGRRLTIAQWADETGLSVQTIRHRMERGYTFDDAVTTPMYSSQKRFESQGVWRTLGEWSKVTGISVIDLQKEMRKGRSLSEIIYSS